ncbi:MAG: hypothetical protein H3C41_00495 [Bacteroidales bacterium]|nr:hypothetical protein [Bacteroidales bacterium]
MFFLLGVSLAGALAIDLKIRILHNFSFSFCLGSFALAFLSLASGDSWAQISKDFKIQGFNKSTKSLSG